MGVTVKAKPKRAKKAHGAKVAKKPLAGLEALNRLSVNRSILADFTVPMKDDDRNTVEIGYGINVDRIAMGRANAEDIGALGFMCNVTLVLCEHGFGDEHAKIAMGAQVAVINAFRRGVKLGRFGVSGDELAALRGTFQLHAEQLQVCGQGHLIAASKEVEKRQANGDVIRVTELQKAA